MNERGKRSDETCRRPHTSLSLPQYVLKRIASLHENRVHDVCVRVCLCLFFSVRPSIRPSVRLSARTARLLALLSANTSWTDYTCRISVPLCAY